MYFLRIVNIRILLIAYFSIFYITPTYCQNASKKQISTIVIDPGHGGKDPGSVGKNSRESDIVLSISLKLGNYIKKYLPDVKVVYTRNTDVYVELHKRADIANKNHADLFISIHANSSKNPAKGTETFAMGYSKSDENLEVARKENSVILGEEDYKNKYKGYDPNSAESYIIFSLVQNTFLQQSLSFASLVQEQFTDKAQRINRGVKQAGFLVLWQTTMPSVLIEVGFISNPEEEKFLNSAKGQDIIASAIFRAFRNYKNQIENKSFYAKDIEGVDNLTDSSVQNELGPIPDTIHPTVDTNTVTPEIINNTPKTNNKILFYIQVASSQKHIALNSSYFKGFSNIKEIKTGNTYKYMVGPKNNYTEISEYSKIVKNYFPDAFIVALEENKIIPLKDALKEIKD